VKLAATLGVHVADFELDVGLTAESGQTYALLGPNGAGKTTLLRALAGLLPIDRGQVSLDEEVLDDPVRQVFVPPEARSVGVVFQDYLLFEHLSARENVAFGLRARGVKRADARATADAWLARLDLSSKATARPRQLSGGQAQRVALARALATDPKLLLLDEPLAALDAATRTTVRRDLRRHLAAFPGVRVLVTHDFFDAAVLADQLLILEDGRLVQTGSVAEIAARPRSRYVADLVGVNLLHGTACGEHVELANGAHITTADAGNGDSFVVIHPRSVALFAQSPSGSPRNAWPGLVDAIENLGDRVRVGITGTVPLVAEVTPAALRELDLDVGSSVWAVVKATDVTVFEA
jgi:molybdate transport system ATP-binding protein